MNINEFLAPPSQSCKREGPHDRIVLSSRVRLARNLKGFPFPGWAKKADRVKALEVVRPAVESLPQMAGAFSESMDNLSAMDKQILVERHLISREHAAKGVGSGLVLNKEETLCVMLNEEDHLRMQALRPGLQLRSAWLAIDQVDSALERRLDYAFSNDLGYLTACPPISAPASASARCCICRRWFCPNRSTRSFKRSTNSVWPCAVSTAKGPRRWATFSRSPTR